MINRKWDFAEVTDSTASKQPLRPTGRFDYGSAYNQIHLHQGEFLHNLGFSGEGMQLAFMDAGFYHYLSLPTFDSVRLGNQILGTWDFVANKESVNEEHPHGMQCMSAVAANMPGTFVGTAPKSAFYLFRTEDVGSEYPIEEQNFLAAAERADSAGVDVFSVSLGYNRFDNSIYSYVYANMDGRTTTIARAVQMASRKGILVVVAAGNEGNKSWHYITTPADADSIITVGAVNINRQPASFSSYGPSADNRIKPDVAAVGSSAVIANTYNGLPVYGNGTSFACPIIAGITTSLWQAFPEASNMQVIRALQLAGDHVALPDNRVGYGVPDVKKAFVWLEQQLYSRQLATLNADCDALISWQAKAGNQMQFVIERKLPGDVHFSPIDTLPMQGPFEKKIGHFTDNLKTIVPPIDIQYRIRMDVASDTSFYLDTITIHYENSCANKVSIYPNPVEDELMVEIANNQNSTFDVSVFNAVGQQVAKAVSKKVNGRDAIHIPFNTFSRGIYWVAVYQDGKKIMTKKVLK